MYNHLVFFYVYLESISCRMTQLFVLQAHHYSYTPTITGVNKGMIGMMSCSHNNIPTSFKLCMNKNISPILQQVFLFQAQATGKRTRIPKAAVKTQQGQTIIEQDKNNQMHIYCIVPYHTFIIRIFLHFTTQH